MALNWTCVKCGAFNPQQRACCWQCDTERLSGADVESVLAKLREWQLLERQDSLPAVPENVDRGRWNWLMPAALFCLSLLAFVIVGWLLWVGLGTFTWVDFGVLVFALLFHECGHYVGMRVYGYRDVKMFFIPLFGAAVSGYSVNVSVMEEALVLLSGPVPGLLLGYGCGVFYLLTGVEAWQKAAQFLVVLNGVNLLPLYPLDGGRLALAIFGGRSARGDTVLQGFLTLLSVAAALWKGGFALGISLGLLLRLGGFAKLNQITHRIRTAGGMSRVNRQGLLSEATVVAVISMLRRERPNLTTASEIAEAVMTICREVNARRLSGAERTLLTVVYVGLLFSLIGAWYVYQTGFFAG